MNKKSNTLIVICLVLAILILAALALAACNRLTTDPEPTMAPLAPTAKPEPTLPPTATPWPTNLTDWNDVSQVAAALGVPANQLEALHEDPNNPEWVTGWHWTGDPQTVHVPSDYTIVAANKAGDIQIVPGGPNVTIERTVALTLREGTSHTDLCRIYQGQKDFGDINPILPEGTTCP